MLLRILAALCGLAVMGSSFVTAFRTGLALEGGTDYLFAVCCAGLVGCSLVFGPIARQRLSDGAWAQGLGFGALWIFTSILVMANSAGYVASHRGDTVGNKQAAIERHEQAKADVGRLNSEIQDADAKGRRTLASALRQQLQEAEGRFNIGKPGSSDAQAEELSWITGSRISVATVARGMPLWMAFAMDLCGNGAFFFALAPHRSRPQRERQQDVEIIVAPRQSEPAKELVVEQKPDRSTMTIAQLDDYREKRAYRALIG